MVPMRISNLAGLNLDRHIMYSHKQDGPVHIAIPEEEVKNRTAIEAELPAPSVRLLDIYLRIYRPLLLRMPSSWLFPGERGGHKAATGLAVQIKTTIARKTGLRVNAHLFRHIAAKLYLDQNPGAYGVIRLIHGHKSVETTTRSYCGTETTAAMRQLDAQVLKLKEPGAETMPSGKRRASARTR
jgi:integrase